MYRFRWVSFDDEFVLLEILGESQPATGEWAGAVVRTLKVIFMVAVGRGGS